MKGNKEKGGKDGSKIKQNKCEKSKDAENRK